ncbi:MAG: hypothetical protein HUU32_08895 [Calditrichaceae bacterium]|nr:hypothetical protein [Calditrichaceae bacterium]
MAYNVLVGIGGTGARVVEAMVHLCAAGYGPENLSIFLIDPDESNGNLTRTKTLITLYNLCRQSFNPSKAAEKQLFKTNIKIPETLVWKIFKDKNTTLSYYINLKTMTKELEDFASVLFSEVELNTILNEGFRGHPSIGSVVMSDPPQDEEPWTVLWDDIITQKQNDVRVFLAGSVFGGTGAAGVPTIGSQRLIKYNDKATIGAGKSRVLLGGALVLPYFSIEREDETDEKMYVTHYDFPIATKAALQYYNEKQLGFDQLYFIGDSLNQKIGKFSVGSMSQENQPHYIELVTALAATDFFEQPPLEGDPEKLYYIACRDDDSVTWESLPVSRNEQEIRQRQIDFKARLVTMSAFAYTFCTYGKDTLDKPHKDINDTWYREHFRFDENKEKERVKNPRWGENKTQLENFEKFLKHYYLAWLCSMDDNSDKVRLISKSKICEGSIQIGKEINLIDYNKKKDNLGDFLKEKSKKEDFYVFINRFLNSVNITDEKTLSAANKYINIFYEAAMKFCAHNYHIQ